MRALTPPKPPVGYLTKEMSKGFRTIERPYANGIGSYLRKDRKRLLNKTPGQRPGSRAKSPTLPPVQDITGSHVKLWRSEVVNKFTLDRLGELVRL